STSSAAMIFRFHFNQWRVAVADGTNATDATRFGEERQLNHLITPSLHYSFSDSAATPGNSLPSSNSSEAPPPVEMNVILSASPACLTAVTESPPPMIVVPPDCASAS